MKQKTTLLIVICTFAWATACSASLTASPQTASTLLPETALPSPTRAATQTTSPLTETSQPEPLQPTATSPEQVVDTPQPACVTLTYSLNAQVEMVSPAGVRVFVDVYDPALLTSPASGDDILLTTHTHFDHVNDAFLSSFPGPQLFTKAASLEQGDVSILGIASAHNNGDRMKPEGGTNYIYIIEIGGLRFAHFGDIGQNSLTPEQLEALGQVDVAIMQLSNSYSDMNAQNQKGFNLMDQLKPKIIIPTHLNLEAAQLAMQKWPSFYTSQPSIQVCLSDIPQETQLILMGENVEKFLDNLDLSELPD